MTAGKLTNYGQHDWLAVTLTANQAYEFTISGLSQYGTATIGTAAELADDGLIAASVAVLNAAVTPVTSNVFQTLYFMPSSSGTYYLDVSDPEAASVPEPYTATVTATSADYTDNPAAPGIVTVGGQVSGKLTNIGQHDWIAVTLAANQAYEINVTGLSSYGSAEIGTASELANEGKAAASIDVYQLITGAGLTSTQALYFKPSVAGTYYIDIADGSYSAPPETYTVSVATAASGTATSGTVASGGQFSGTLSNIGDHDWVAVTLTANQAYQISVLGLSFSGYARIGTAAGLAADGPVTASSQVNYTIGGVVSSAVLASSTLADSFYFMPSFSGTYYIDVTDSHAPTTYTVSVATTTADVTDNATAPGAVTVGGQFVGQLTNTGQHDWVAVTLTAHQAYNLHVTGLSGEGSVILGTAATLTDGTAAGQPNWGPEALSGSLLAGFEGYSNDLFFTPTTTGTYYIDISDHDQGRFSAPETYTVTVNSTTADVGHDPTTAGSVAVGGVFSGQLTNIDQHDWVSVNLISNQAYVVEVFGLTGYPPITIGTAAQLDAGGQNASFINVGHYIQSTSGLGSLTSFTEYLYFMPSSSGTYYVDVNNAASNILLNDAADAITTESYTVLVATTTADFTDNPTAPGSLGSAAGGPVSSAPTLQSNAQITSFSIADSAANILAALNGLLGDTKLSAVTLTGPNTVTLAQANLLIAMPGFALGTGAGLTVSNPTVNNADGTSYVYAFAPSATALKTTSQYAGAAGSSTKLSDVIDNVDGTSLIYAYNPNGSVKQTALLYSAYAASTGAPTGSQVSAVVDKTDGTSLVYSYNPTSAVTQTASQYSGYSATDGSPTGSQVSVVVDNADGTSLVYAYNPTGTVKLTATKWTGFNAADGSTSGSQVSAVVDNTDGTSLLYAFNPTTSVTKTATLYSGADATNGAPTGTALVEVFDYTNGQSAVTRFTNGTGTTSYYTGTDGTGTTITSPSLITLSSNSASVSAGLGASSLTFVGTPNTLTLAAGPNVVSGALIPANGVTEISNFLYGLDQIKIDLNGAARGVFSVSDTSVGGQHAISLYSSADPTHGIALVNFASAMTASDLQSSHLVFSNGFALIN